MLHAQITNCTNCLEIQDTLDQINCTLAWYGRNHWYNISFDACSPYPRETIVLLAHYKRILTHRLYNPDWACGTDLSSIISRVKVLAPKSGPQCCPFAEYCEFPEAPALPGDGQAQSGFPYSIPITLI